MFLVHPTLSVEEMHLYGKEILSIFRKSTKITEYLIIQKLFVMIGLIKYW